MDDYGNTYQTDGWWTFETAYGYSMSTFGWFDDTTLEICVRYGIDYAAQII